MVRPGGFEPPTTWFVARYSIQLSYGRSSTFGTAQNGAPGRIRTSDHLVRSQVLYPAELRALTNFCVLLKMVRPGGFEPPTTWFVARYSIQLSYGRSQTFDSALNGAPGRIRTSDHLVRSQVLYPAELRAP